MEASGGWIDYGDLELFHKLANDAEQAEKFAPHVPVTQSSQLPTQASIPDDATLRVPGSAPTNSSSIVNYSTQYSKGSMFSSPPPSQIFRATIPFAMMMLSCMEMIGYLAKPNAKAGQTAKNIRNFLSHVPIRIDKKDIDFLVNIFRHGLAHNYFPKLNHGISYHKKNPANILFFRAPGVEGRTLDVNFLEASFRIGLEAISQDGGLYAIMDVQYTRLIQSYKTGQRYKAPEICFAIPDILERFARKLGFKF